MPASAYCPSRQARGMRHSQKFLSVSTRVLLGHGTFNYVPVSYTHAAMTISEDTSNRYDRTRAVEWDNGRIKLLDQRALPTKIDHLYIGTLDHCAQAIRDMVVRGAPAIGVTAAYGVVLGARDRYAEDPQGWKQAITADLEHLANARPTAVNLRWAVDQMREVIRICPPGDPTSALLARAEEIHAADIAANRRMGELGAALIAVGSGVLTHCNTGSLATGGFGTALGVVRA